MNKIFLDSNILIYLYSIDENKKTATVKTILQDYEDIVISTQVLFEFSYVVSRKFKLSYPDIEAALKEIHDICNVVLITYETLLKRLKIAPKYKYSFPDSLIVATAIEHNCTILLSEDMHDKQIIENSLNILNPFDQ